jgi:hypothetical protein
LNWSTATRGDRVPKDAPPPAHKRASDRTAMWLVIGSPDPGVRSYWQSVGRISAQESDACPWALIA